MSLLLSMLPYYLLGNLHCAGMCGPLVLMIGKHRYRYLYFLGRTLSFTAAGFLAGAAGAVVNIYLNQYHLPALLSIFFGLAIIYVGISSLLKISLNIFNKQLARASRSLTLLILRDKPWPTFLFGFFTLVLPCGQTVVVFSACAIYGDPWVGFINGLCFALLTTPSLMAAMYASALFHKLKPHYNIIMGICALLIGTLAICRGLAEFNFIPHLIVNSQYHLVIY